jgi:hypothetical protein
LRAARCKRMEQMGASPIDPEGTLREALNSSREADVAAE